MILHLTIDEIVFLLGNMPNGPDRRALKTAAFAYLYAPKLPDGPLPLFVHFEEGRFDLAGLNCHAAHLRELSRRESGELHYGWAVAPDGKRYQHCWIQSESGEIEDIFGWTNHEDLGIREIR